ncbi:hypothetical protein [Providencia phage PSTCR6]|nr:hypothetical protein [Providencia phage PSTCR6]
MITVKIFGEAFEFNGPLVSEGFDNFVCEIINSRIPNKGFRILEDTSRFSQFKLSDVVTSHMGDESPIYGTANIILSVCTGDSFSVNFPGFITVSI